MIKKILSIASWIVVAILLLLAGAMVLSNFNTPLKLRLFSVLSGSMEPAISTGSLVFTLNQNDYQVDDVITVRAKNGGKETVTHRIAEVIRNEEENVTLYDLKGDANENRDPEPINKNRVIGKVVFQLPYLGRVVGFTQTQQGFILLIVLPATLLIYSELMSIKNEVVKMLAKKKPVLEEKNEGEALHI